MLSRHINQVHLEKTKKKNTRGKPDQDKEKQRDENEDLDATDSAAELLCILSAGTAREWNK